MPNSGRAVILSIMRHWTKFAAVWVFFFANAATLPLLASPRFYEERPKVAWSIFFAWWIITGLSMVFLKGIMLRLVLDKSMSAGTRNLLFILPTMLLGVLGVIVGSCLKFLIWPYK